MHLGHQILGYLFRPRFPKMEPVRFMHTILCSVLAMIAAVLFMPWNTFATGDSWHDIASWFTEPQFATICAVFAAVGFIGGMSRHNVIQAIAATAICLVHLMIALSFVDSNRIGIGGWLCLFFAVQGAFVARRRLGGE